MVSNESFLDTAITRDSVVSHAKSLGYVPYSISAAKAVVDLAVVTDNTTIDTLTLNRGFNFRSSLVDNISYNFTLIEDVTVTKSGNQYYFESLPIYQGEISSATFTYDETTNPKAIFTLPVGNIDTRTIKVSVIDSSSNSTTEVYNYAPDILDVDNTSAVFFIQEGRADTYQVYFGDGVIGKKISDGSIVTISYLVTKGAECNDISGFTVSGTISQSYEYVLVTDIFASSGGSDKESIDAIRYSAPLQYTTQNRLVTVKDYELYLTKNYPASQSISVWGGEEQDPPVYGKVFISIKPKDGYYISELEKQRIIDEIIKPKSIITVDTQILDPEYVYLMVMSSVHYDKKKTSLSEESIKTNIRNAVISYNNDYLDEFGSTFVLSKLQDYVEATDSNAIIGSEITLRLQKRIQPLLNEFKTYTINFDTRLHRGTSVNGLRTTEFGTFDSLGVLRNCKIEEIPESYTGVSRIDVLNPGTGYTTAPTVTITGDGTGAQATATIVNGRIKSIEITNRGINYSRAIVSITGGDGYGAQAVAVLDTRFGNLRTIYYDTNAERKIVNANAGTIDYDTGEIILNNLKIISVNAVDGLFRMDIESQDTIISSKRNSIFSIDETDPASIVTELTII
jgi:hypothetical protein